MGKSTRWLWIATTIVLVVIASWGWLRPTGTSVPMPTAVATFAEVPTLVPTVEPTEAPTVVPTPAPTLTPLELPPIASGESEPTPTEPTPTARESASPSSTPTVVITASASLGTLDAYFLDIDQGDSILLMGPDFTILIDAGRRERSDVVPYLDAIGVQEIDLLVGTHPHADHIGQFPQVLARFPVREVWMSGDESTTLTFERAIDAVIEAGAGYHEPRAGEVYQIGSARIEVLNPAVLTGDLNEGSVAFRLIFGQVAFMFTGDLESPAEHEILESGYELQAQILKLGHHGSDTSSSLDFLLAVEPEIAVWSAGIDNTYGHPSPLTLQRLQDLGVAVYGTAVDGTVVVQTDGQHFEVVEFDPSVSAQRGCAPAQIDINTASIEELEAITQIGPARAQIMFELRPFSSVDDMVRVPGITATALEKIKGQGLACVE